MILVTGGTGRLGGQVVRVLRSAGLDVRCVVRKGSEYFWLNDTGSAYFFGDLRDPKSLSRALRDVQYLVAAHGVRTESTDNNHRNVNAEGSIALFDAAKARGVHHVVYISCAGVEAGSEVPLFSAKRAAEDHLQQSGLAYTILRPGLFVQNFADLARRVEANGSVFLPGRAGAAISPIHTRDLALMCLASLDLPAVHNRVVPVGGPERMTVEQAFSRMCTANGLTPAHWKLPPAGLRAVATVARAAGRRWTNRVRALEVLYGHDHAVDPAEMTSTFGIALTPFDEAAVAAFTERHPSEDPTARDEKVVHRQFTATIYEPGTIRWDDLPAGPPPRQD
jgi:uncharacterized protein YbjT (DUF2867 family)